SSRRRHTRFDCDWSSDVCSSDLYLFRFATIVLPQIPRRLAYALGNVAGLIAWLFAGKARKQATRNMIHVLGAQVQETRAGRRKQIGRASCRERVEKTEEEGNGKE